MDLEAALLKGEERGEAGGPCVSSAGAVVPKSLGPDFYNREQYFKVYDAFSGKEKAINLALPDISLKREYYRNFYDLLTQRVMRSEFIRTRTILNSGLPPVSCSPRILPLQGMAFCLNPY